MSELRKFTIALALLASLLGLVFCVTLAVVTVAPYFGTVPHD